jgi:hypothetical protein
MFAFLYPILFPSLFTCIVEPWGQVFGPSVGVLLYFDYLCFNYSCFFGFSDEEFLQFDRAQFIVIAVSGCNFFKLLREITSIAVDLPLRYAMHVCARVFFSNPFITFPFHCRGV